MSNHIHLAVRVADISIPRIMQHLAFRYARYINRKYKRIGHLFQGQFKSILVDDEDYLKDHIRSIHLNPVRAKLVPDPLQYFWSIHSAYLELEEFCEIHNIIQKQLCMPGKPAKIPLHVPYWIFL